MIGRRHLQESAWGNGNGGTLHTVGCPADEQSFLCLQHDANKIPSGRTRTRLLCTAKYNIADTGASSILLYDQRSTEPVRGQGRFNKCHASVTNHYQARLRCHSWFRQVANRPCCIVCRQGSSMLSKDNILITSGPAAAKSLVFFSLIGPCDHVFCHYPTDGQLYRVS